MLVISRRKGQSITIGDEIELVVTELHRSTVKLGIRAPRGLAVLRGEIRETIEQANRDAAASSMEAAVALAQGMPEAPPGSAAGVEVALRRREVRELAPAKPEVPPAEAAPSSVSSKAPPVRRTLRGGG
jgi:carbon storage regulator